MTQENRCPLCGKLNPASEWACESCGAQLPRHGQRESAQTKPTAKATVAGKPSASTPQTTTPTPTPRAGNGCLWGCMAALFCFVLLPLSCSLFTSGTATPTPAPTPISAPAATPTTRSPAPKTPALPLAPRAPQAQPPVVNPQSPTVPPTPDVGNLAPRVWVNTKTGAYHYPGGRWYGVTDEGRYMTEAQAIAAGYRATQR